LYTQRKVFFNSKKCFFATIKEKNFFDLNIISFDLNIIFFKSNKKISLIKKRLKKIQIKEMIFKCDIF